MSEEEVTERLQKQWGLKQLLMGKWPNYTHTGCQSEAESLTEAALWLINYIERGGLSPDVVKGTIKRIMGLGNSNAASKRPSILG